MASRKRPTIGDVAAAAEVGVATVDRVLNRRAPVSEATARRVLDAARTLGFHAAGLMKRRIDEQAAERSFGFLLQRGSENFYRALGEALARATRASTSVIGRPIVDYLDDLSPASVREGLLRLAARTDAVAMVAADHPKIVAAVETVRQSGTPVLTLLSDLPASGRTCFLGIDHRKAGRTAAWAVSRLARTPGPVAVMIGSHRYLGHELSEIGFRSYFREHAPDFRVLDAMMSLEDARLAYETTLSLLRRIDNLAGLYVAGGGMEGAIEACREHGGARKVVVICNELIPETRSALIDDVVDLVIATPVDLLAREATAVMALALEHPSRDMASSLVLPFEIYTAENV